VKWLLGVIRAVPLILLALLFVSAVGLGPFPGVLAVAGGIGFYIQLYVRGFQYPKVATLTVVVLIMVVLVEQLSVALRRRLR
jgi:ABC-type phosphate/phosphonate transport system permease subunit